MRWSDPPARNGSSAVNGSSKLLAVIRNPPKGQPQVLTRIFCMNTSGQGTVRWKTGQPVGLMPSRTIMPGGAASSLKEGALRRVAR